MVENGRVVLVLPHVLLKFITIGYSGRNSTSIVAPCVRIWGNEMMDLLPDPAGKRGRHAWIASPLMRKQQQHPLWHYAIIIQSVLGGVAIYTAKFIILKNQGRFSTLSGIFAKNILLKSNRC